jgi:DNA-directed RNA polymerase subunit RPC12/RpoP
MICGSGGVFAHFYHCELCGGKICYYHPEQVKDCQINLRAELVSYIFAYDPGSVQVLSLRKKMSTSGHSSFAFVCLRCRSWVNGWSKAQHENEKYTERQRSIELAKKYEIAGRYEDAARQYESADLWKEAGEVRRQSNTTTVKNISVNLNELMADLRRGGLALNYKCHNCGGTLTFDGRSAQSNMSFCPYCGSKIDTETLASLLRTALG